MSLPSSGSRTRGVPKDMSSEALSASLHGKGGVAWADLAIQGPENQHGSWQDPVQPPCPKGKLAKAAREQAGVKAQKTRARYPAIAMSALLHVASGRTWDGCLGIRDPAHHPRARPPELGCCKMPSLVAAVCLAPTCKGCCWLGPPRTARQQDTPLGDLPLPGAPVPTRTTCNREDMRGWRCRPTRSCSSVTISRCQPADAPGGAVSDAKSQEPSGDSSARSVLGAG